MYWFNENLGAKVSGRVTLHEWISGLKLFKARKGLKLKMGKGDSFFLKKASGGG